MLEENAPPFPCVVFRFGLESRWKRRSVSLQELSLIRLFWHLLRSWMLEENAPSFPCVVFRFGLESSWKRRSVSLQESSLNILNVDCCRVRGKEMDNRGLSLAELLYLE